MKRFLVAVAGISAVIGAGFAGAAPGVVGVGVGSAPAVVAQADRPHELFNIIW